MKEKILASQEKKITPNHSEMLLDESMYELQVEKVRQGGAAKERKGVMTAISRFLKTPSGKSIGMALSAAAAYTYIEAASFLLDEQLKRQPKNIDDIIDTEPAPDSFAGDRPLESVRHDLADWIGEDAMRDLVPVTSSDRERFTRDRRREEIRQENVAEVSGFSEVGVSDELVSRYLEQGFPRFLTGSRDVASIQFTAEHQAMPESYHLARGAEAAGICYGGKAGEASRIELYGALVDSSGRFTVEDAFQDVMIHELAHSIDWKNLDAVDPATRARMLHQMVSHVRDDKSRLQFSYVEEITSKDPQEQLLNRATEYYAELTANVFTHAPIGPAEDPLWSLNAAQALILNFGTRGGHEHGDVPTDVQAVVADVELVRAVVRAYDPEFQWDTAALTRQSLIGEMRGERTKFELRRVASAIESDAARALVMNVIDEITPAEEVAMNSAFFARHSYKGLSLLTNEISDSVSADTTSELLREAFELRKFVQPAQSRAVRRLEQDVAQTDMPAYQELYTLLEALPDFYSETASPAQIDAIEVLIKEYRMAARHATPAHVEAARKHFEIVQGTRDLPPDVRVRVDRFIDHVYSAMEGPFG